MEFIWNEFCGMGLQFEVDGFRMIYGLLATFMWCVCLVFSKEYMAHCFNKSRYYLFTILTYIATMGVLFSADLYTTFIFFEIMSFTSYVWVVQDEQETSLKAGATYLTVAIIGGLVMLMGLFLLYDMTGTLVINELSMACKPYYTSKRLYVAGGCFLVGFGAKAGVFPLHIWLPKAHPVAPAPASALLSGVLTKTGIYGILVITTRIFIGDKLWSTILLLLGVITMFLGAVLALFSNNIKRTLACSSVSQIGFIVIGIAMQGFLGEENMLAIGGTFLHMVNHSLIKLVLFVAAGIIYMNIHKLDLNDIKGFGRNKPLLHLVFLLGATGIAGIPLGNGYISKTLLHESIIKYIEMLHKGYISPYSLDELGMKVVEWTFLICGGITVAYMTKLYIAIFIEKNEIASIQLKYDSMKKHYMNQNTAFVVVFSAVILPLIGVFPHIITDKLLMVAQEFMNGKGLLHTVHYFDLVNMRGAAISIIIGVVVYLLVVRKYMMIDGKQYVNRWSKKLDLEVIFYKPVLCTILPIGLGIICRIMDRFVDRMIVILRKTVYKDSKIPCELVEGNAFTHFIGSMLQRGVNILNKTIWMDRPYTKQMEHSVSVLWDELSENNTIISRSLSFGLMMVCLGILMVLIYLLMLV